MDRIAVELEERRSSEGLSRAKFAKKLHLSASTYSRICRGLYPPSATVMRNAIRLYPELAEALRDDEGAA